MLVREQEKTSWFRGLRLLTASLRTRFMILVVGLFCGLTIAMIMAASYLDLRDEEQTALDRATAVAMTVSRLAVPHLSNHHYLILEQELESIVSDPLVRQVLVHDPARNIMVDGDPATSYFDRLTVPGSLQRVLDTGRPSFRMGRVVIEVTVPVRSGVEGETLGAAFVAIVRPEAGVVIWTIWQRNAVIAVFLLAVALPVTFHLGNGFLKPVRHLTQTAHRVSAGDFDAPFPVDRHDEIGVLARAYHDMVQRIRANLEDIHRLAFVDGVTELFNRERFRQEVDQAIGCARQAGENLAVLFIDLDRFKRVNDTYGHDAGDRLLKEIADRIGCVLKLEGSLTPDARRPASGDRTGTLPDRPVVARLGGDEFAVLLPGEERTLAAGSVAADIVRALKVPLDVGGLSMVVGASVGVARFPQDGTCVTSLLKNADIAMYEAKKDGGSGYRFYDAESDRIVAERVRMEEDLRTAVARGEFELFYQPQVDARSQSPIGVEALMRWRHPEKGLLAPGAFIDLLEETGLILDLGGWLIETACRQGAEWSEAGLELRVAVNISLAQFLAEGFADMVLETVARTGMRPDLLELEITESMAMANTEQVARAVGRMREAGIRFAIDDFGTGYSSLSHLKRLPFDVFKIDRTFIAGIGDDESAMVIVQTILAMAGSLGYETVAEGVETSQQLDFVTIHGCQHAQGFLFGKPMPAGELRQWLSDNAASELKATLQTMQDAAQSTVSACAVA